MKRFAHVLSLAVLMVTSGACSETSPTAPPAPGLPPTFIVSGAVTSAGLVPIDDAKVLIQGADRLHAATTDASGQYTVSGVRVGSKSISVSKDGYEPKYASVMVSGDTQLDIQMVPFPRYTLSGVVFETTREGHAPVAGVWLHWSEEHLDAVSDATGFYSLDVFKRTGTLWASKDGYMDRAMVVAISSDMRLDVELTTR
jgi:hypothetical protein